ncbi:MAG: hypothetical protein DMG24_21220, partial [Acidobacteria bacterium]
QTEPPICQPAFPTSIFYLIDSSGHSRFVLRILIILSHPQRFRPRQAFPRSHPSVAPANRAPFPTYFPDLDFLSY